jgi:hypothetical protein
VWIEDSLEHHYSHVGTYLCAQFATGAAVHGGDNRRCKAEQIELFAQADQFAGTSNGAESAPLASGFIDLNSRHISDFLYFNDVEYLV